MVFILSVSTGFSEESAIEYCTIKRTEDPLVLTLGELADWIKGDYERIALFCFHGTEKRQIIFQVDEVDPLGVLVLDKGNNPGSDNDKGKLDANDLLVFQADGLGDRHTGEKLFGQAEYAEIEVIDPVNSSKGWVYLVKDFKPVVQDLVSIIFSKDGITIQGIRYLLRYASDRYYIDLLKIYNDDNSRFGNNLINRSKITSSFQLKWFTIILALKTFHKDEEDVKYKIQAYRDGPVRVILRARPQTMIIPKIALPSEWADSLFYRNHCILSSYIVSSFDVSTLCSAAKFKASFDFNQNVIGYSFISDEYSKGVIVNGIMDDEKISLQKIHPKWFSLFSSDCGFMSSHQLSPALQKLPLNFSFIDNSMSEKDAQNNHCGSTPEIGYEYDVLGLQKGKYRIDDYIIFYGKHFDDIENNYLLLMQNPLEASVTRIFKFTD